MKVIPDVLMRHAEEVSLLWMSRDVAVCAPHYSLPDLATLDGRIEAHLDGLRSAGDCGWETCVAELAAVEPGEVFTAGIIALESGKAERVGRVLAAVEAAPETLGGLVSALGWLPLAQVRAKIQELLQSEAPLHRRIGIAAAAAHRWHPGVALRELVGNENPSVRARALKAVGELGDMNLKPLVEPAIRDADAECRFAAAWSGALLGLPTGAAVLQEIAESNPARAAAAAGVAVPRMGSSAVLAWQKRLAGKAEHARLAILVAGLAGDPALVPWLIPLMGRLPLARLAGEAFTMITGVDLAYRDLERKPPEDFDAGPTEDPKDENVAMDPDDNLPWPQPALVQKWWEANEGRFPAGVRHLMGQPITEAWMEKVLRGGRQRQRAAAAIELAMLRPGQPLFNVRAPGFRQQQILGKSDVIR